MILFSCYEVIFAWTGNSSSALLEEALHQLTDYPKTGTLDITSGKTSIKLDVKEVIMCILQFYIKTNVFLGRRCKGRLIFQNTVSLKQKIR
jgi:hypothetical protein